MQMGKPACTDVQTLDGLTHMSKQADRPECEYGWRLRERISAEQSAFMIFDVCVSRHFRYPALTENS